MNQIMLSFTTDEYRELAKLLNLAKSVLTSCEYDNQPMVDEIFNRVCETGFMVAPETGAFMEAGLLNNTPFDVSPEIHSESVPLLELFEMDCVKEHLPYSLAERDFNEMHGVRAEEAITQDDEVLRELESIQKKYLDEFEIYGITHLRLEGDTNAAKENRETFFAPQLLINNGIKDISFYANAFGATQNLCFFNDDGSIHVAELSINGAIFHLHEVTKQYFFTPEKYNGTTAIIGLFVSDVDDVMNKAIKAGATQISEAKDYEYGYRQGEIRDPFGHHWLIQKKCNDSMK
jgi:PhnB protein